MFFKSKVFVACLGIAAMTAFGVGCGDDGDDGNGGGGEYTSIDGSAELGSLSAEDEAQLCEDGAAYSEANAPSVDKQKGCNLGGNVTATITFASDSDLDAAKAACESAVTTCMDADDQPVDETDPCESPTEYPETCTATVDEFVACQEATVAANKELYNNVKDCADLTEDDLKAEEDSGEEPSGPCVTYQDKCQ